MRSSRAALAAAVVCAGLAAGVALLASSASAQRREGNAIELSGRKVSCDNVEVVMDRRLPSEGAAAPGVLILNPRMLNEQPAIVRLFVFHHECGHHRVGDSELKADCWAVERGVRDGWLNQRGLKEVCKSFEDAPETPSHPSGRRRCRNLDQCFANAVAALPPRTPVASTATAIAGGGCAEAGQGADAARHGLAALCRRQALRRAAPCTAQRRHRHASRKRGRARRLQLMPPPGVRTPMISMTIPALSNCRESAAGKA